jgi:hypothetical protein
MFRRRKQIRRRGFRCKWFQKSCLKTNVKGTSPGPFHIDIGARWKTAELSVRAGCGCARR